MAAVSIEEKKAFLSQGISIQTELQLLNDVRQQVYNDATHITGNISAIAVSNGRNIRRFDKLAEIDGFIVQKEKELCALRSKIIKAIYTVPSLPGRSVLICRYIHGLSAEATAEKLSYSERHIKRLQAEAIEQIDITLCESA